MLSLKKHPSLAASPLPFGAVEVKYTSPDSWDIPAFRALVSEEIALLKENFPADCYDRKAVWGENAYVRYFKRFKKTFPVMLQFESVVLKGRPFPCFNPAAEVAFLTEITTFCLSGAHDADCIRGDVELYLADTREDFEGMRETLHTYPNDFCGRDSSGIIFSMIAGTDKRTCATNESRNVLYPVFCTADMPAEYIEKVMSTIVRYAKTLCPDAEVNCRII